jgi:oligopeptide transport system substrate-binding protein
MPTSISPLEQKSSSAIYMLNQIYAPLLRLKDGKLFPNTATCHFKKDKLVICKINPTSLWSDGRPLQANDYVSVMQSFVDPKNVAYRADLLFGVRNAQQIFLGKLPPKKLGVTAKGDELTIQLEEPDSSFLYTLAQPLLTPAPTDLDPLKAQTPGPYRISLWDQKGKIVLSPNPHWPNAGRRPQIEFIVLNDDNMALNLYEKSDLDFVRRVPSLYLKKFANRSDLFRIPQYRMDYFGFGKALQGSEFLQLRQSIATSIDYEKLQNLYVSDPRPGCIVLPGIPLNNKLCHPFNDPSADKKIKLTLPEGLSQLTFVFAKQGGDDHKRTAEWLQVQWLKNTGLKIQLDQMDEKLLFDKLGKNEIPFFRKGLSPDRPVCLDILKTFSKSSKENFIALEDLNYEKIILKLQKTKRLAEQTSLCQKAFEILMTDYKLIPTGPIMFSVLSSPKWKNWSLNELNQLDLTDLEAVNLPQ